MSLQGIKIITVAAVLCGTGAAVGQVAIARSAFGAGGGTVTAGTLSVSATIGQSIAGSASASPFIVDAGFWTPGAPTPPACLADFNGDTFLDPDDLSDFITCFFLDVQTPGTCVRADFNNDGLRDQDDLSDFITAFFTGC